MSKQRASWWSILGDIFAPWFVVFYIWWLGLRWTIIGLGILYGVALLVATGIVIGRAQRGR